MLNLQENKILILSALFPPEPVVSAKISFDIANALSETNSVSVISQNPSRPYGFKFKNINQNFHFNHIIINSYICPESNLFGRIRESYSFGQKCKKFIDRNNKEIDIIYMSVWPLFAQFFVLRTAIRFNIKVITHIQDIYPESFTNKLPTPLNQFFHWLLLPIDKYVLKNSNHIIAISEKMKEYLIITRFVPCKKISVVTNWQDENEFLKFHQKNKRIVDHENLIFMYLGNIGPVAGIEFLIESFAEAKLSDAKLVVAGSGSMKAYCQNLSLKFIDADISFIDVPEGKVAEIQDRADVLLLPIRKGAAMSSIPSKLPAYMFSKKPVLACVDANSDTADSIHKSGCGWVTEPENKEQLIEVFKSISKDKRESRIEKGENGFKYAMLRFSKKNNLKKITDLIIDLNKESA